MKNQYMYYPGHGVGRVLESETKKLQGRKVKFISLEIISTGMKILVPTENAKIVGLRKLMDKATAKEVRGMMLWPDDCVKHDEVLGTSWNKIYREYMELVKTGKPLDMAKVLASLEVKKQYAELSFGERKMLDFCKSILTIELDLVLREGA